MTTPEMIELKLTTSNVRTRWPCGVCGDVADGSSVTVEADHGGPHCGLLCCETCLKAGDLDVQLEEHATRLEQQAARTRSLIGRLKAPTYAEWAAYSERAHVADTVAYGFQGEDTDGTFNTIMADDEVYAMWRKQLKQEDDDHNRQREHQRQRRALLGIPDDVDEDFPF